MQSVVFALRLMQCMYNDITVPEYNIIWYKREREFISKIVGIIKEMGSTLKHRALRISL